MQCKDCGVEINETNKATREKGKWRKECRKCWSKKYKEWAARNRDKTRANQKRYDRKKGIGIDVPCQYCGKLAKKKCQYHFCSDKCRFVDKVEKKDNGCWIWKGKITNSGYGEFNIRGKHMLAHRYSYELFKSKIPKGKSILHSCDVRECVNPVHLRAGTQKDNMQDAKKKGRLPNQKGLNNSSSKLTKEMIQEIRILDQNKIMTRRDIAKRFNVSAGTISHLLNKKTFQEVV